MKPISDKRMNPEKTVCYKWIICNVQQMNFMDYILTDKYYSSRAEVEKKYGADKTESCFYVVQPLLMTRQTGDIAWILTKHER